MLKLRNSRLAVLASGVGAIGLALVLTQQPSQAAPNGNNGNKAKAVLSVSDKSDRSNPRGLDGTTLSGRKWIFVSNPTNVSKVVFFLDEPNFANITHIENFQPFDLMGTKDDGNSQVLDMSTLKAGQHSVSAVLLEKGQKVELLKSTFTVVAVATPPATTPPVSTPPVSTPPASGTINVHVALNGANEVGQAGDPDGMGVVDGTIDVASNTFCYGFALQNIDTVTAMRIYRAPAGTNGAAVAEMLIPATGSVSNQLDACSPVPADVVQRISANPQNYYINVLTTAFPKGAIRGQLG